MTITPDLLSLVLTMRPLKTGGTPDTHNTGMVHPVGVHHGASQPLPQWWGRAAHALLLKLVLAANPTLAESLHEGDGPRPFTTSTLMGRFPRHQLDPQGRYMLRLTALEATLVSILLEAANSGPLAPGGEVELDYIPFRLEGVTWDTTQHPWAGLTSYQELSAPLLLAKQPAPKRIDLQFTSPTSFKSKEMHVPLPLPDLVFGGLLERWNAFAPIAFPPEVKRYAEECLAVARYRLSSRIVPIKSRGMRIGAVGDVRYVSLNYDRYWMSVIGTLASFALYSGVGAGVSQGMGQCRLLPSASE